MNSEVSKIFTTSAQPLIENSNKLLCSLFPYIYLSKGSDSMYAKLTSLAYSIAILFFSVLPVFVTVTFFYLIFKAKTLDSKLTPFFLSSTLFPSFLLISYRYVFHIFMTFFHCLEILTSICLVPCLGYQLLFSCCGKIPWPRQPRETRICLSLQFQRNSIPSKKIVKVSS